ncbi:tetratricopeptide repeat protein [Streptomyces sp. NPDC059853]|uniref:tetratricopeptide repeat protein n=1 Tax=Streptomyces sp. NPDC059853 TaxID=3346973 RepID=UPI00364C4C2F
MATSPNRSFRALRGDRSAAEFAAAVRRAAREIGENVSCDARYIGRVESGVIRCPNYAYERVFRHMFPGRTLTDLGFAPRDAVRGRGARAGASTSVRITGYTTRDRTGTDNTEESDVLRRVFMAGGPAAVASLTPLTTLTAAAAGTATGTGGAPAPPRRVGAIEAAAVERAVTDIRAYDDRHGADALYRPAGESLRAAQELLDAGTARAAVSARLHAAAGELALSVGWLAHDSGRHTEARSHYAEALATARVSDDRALEAHAFCNAAFLARDTGRHREAVRAAQAGQQAARATGSHRLHSLLSLREAAGWAGLGDRRGCELALSRARTAFDHGPDDADPEWMSFYNAAELASQEAHCWAALGDWPRAAEAARRALTAQDPHLVRNRALYTAELAGHLTGGGHPEEAAETGQQALDLLEQVHSSRIRTLLRHTANRLTARTPTPEVAAFAARAA